MTKILFGMALDGARWSKKSSIGVAVFGPRGMMSFLETRLGLTGVEVTPQERAASYQEKVRVANVSWCAKSFNRDPLGTAAYLLRLRDELVMMGWTEANATEESTERVKALAAIERAGNTVPLGRSDRLWRIANAAPLKSSGIEVKFADDISLYPAVWQEIFKNHFRVEIKGKKSVCDGQALPGLEVITAPDEIRLAQELARYLRSGTAEENSNVTLIADGDTTLLDGVLHGVGLPAVGRSESSVYREVLEVMPLWIETMWEPVSPARLVELLAMSCGPLNRSASRILIKALNESPGIGGEPWQKAWTQIESAIDAEVVWKDNRPTKEPISDEKKAEKKARVRKLRNIFESYRHLPDVGIPPQQLVEVLFFAKERFISIQGQIKASQKDLPESANDERLLGLSVAEEQLGKMCEALKPLVEDGRPLPKHCVDRIVSSVIGDGLGRYDAHEEVADYTVVRGPGEIVEDSDTVLWWNFVDPGRCNPIQWRACELNGLAGRHDENKRLKRELATWDTAFRHAKSHFVCFVPQQKCGEVVAPHPYMDNLKCRYGGKDFVRDVTSMEKSGNWTLADRTVALAPIKNNDRFQMPEQERAGSIPPRESLGPQSMSATQLKTFIECPYRWYLKYCMLLNGADVNDLTNERLVLGKLAHKVVERIVNEKVPMDEESVAVRVPQLVDELVPQIAAMLLAPESHDKLAVFRDTLRSSVVNLVRELKKRKLVWEASEVPIKGEFVQGVPFSGSIDLVLHYDQTVKKYIVDFKWSTKKDQYDGYIKDQVAIQLAAYDYFLSGGNFGISCAYYLFPKAEYLDNRQIAESAQKRVRQLDNSVWERCHATYDAWIEKLRKGEIPKGVPNDNFFDQTQSYPKLDEKAREDYLDKRGFKKDKWIDLAPNCCYCEYRVFCGKAKPLEDVAK